jgi:hypothetical protein
MSSIFQQLGYNYNPAANEIFEFDEKVVANMNAMPELLSPWQYEDMRNNDTAITNYVYNPIAQISATINNTCIAIQGACSNISALSTISSTSNTTYTSSVNFKNHADRIAGLVEINENTATLPHYDTAMGVGKTIMYMVYQADGIQNNAPVMGSFTSLFIEDELTTKHNLIISYPTLISNSIYTNSYLDGEGNTVTEITSNLTSTQISTIIANVGSIGTLMNTRRVHDENFFTNSNTILENYKKLKKFKTPGSSETNIINDYIGTNRLKNNLVNTA